MPVALGLIALLAGCDSGAPSAVRPVPPLVGLSAAEAEHALKAAGFRSLVTTASYPPRAAAAVVAQDPPQGQPEPAGTRVRIVVAAPGTSHVVVPDCVGQPWSLAVGLLTIKGLVSRVVVMPSVAGTAGVVLRQSPRAGSLVPVGATVTLRVARKR